MIQDHLAEEVLNKERLAALRELALLDDGPNSFEVIYDRITNLASKIVGTPVALMSMVAADYQFFKSYTGLPEPWSSERSTPLSHSFCQHVVATQEPLIVTDAREVDFLKHNGAIPDLNVIGYLGIPVNINMGQKTRTLGSFCVIDDEPREWTQLEVEIVLELAEIITLELDLKARARVQDAYKTQLDNLHQNIAHMLDELDPTRPKTEVLQQIRKLRETYNVL
jgi:GAF domain-containing protein